MKPPTILPSDAAHPIYGTIRFTVAILGLTVILWGSAESFDYTELQAILAMFVLLATGEGALAWLRRRPTDDK